MRLPVVLTRSAYDELLRHLTRLEKDVRVIRTRVETGRAWVDVDDPAFRALAAEVVSTKRTTLRDDRLWVLWQAAANTARLGHAAAEVGSYRRGSAYFLAGALRAAAGRDVPLDVVDTFAGHPAGSVGEHDDPVHRDPGKFAATSYEDVVEYLRVYSLVTVHRGDFASVAPELPDGPYGLVHVDVDLYEPAHACLAFFGPRLADGGVIVLDDYRAPKCPGRARAAEEFLAANAFQAWHPHTEQLVLVKC